MILHLWLSNTGDHHILVIGRLPLTQDNAKTELVEQLT